MPRPAPLADLPHAEALAVLRAACAAGDRNPVTVLNLAIARDHDGDGPHARHMMQEIAALLPEWDEPHLRIAESWRRAGNAEAAARAYADALDRNPRREEALVARAALLIQRGDPAAARPLLLRCVGVNPENPEAWEALGVALILTDDPRMAETAFAEASRLAPANFGFALHQVEAAHAAGRLEAEAARLQVATEQDPLNAVALTALSLAYERLGRRAEAVDAVEAASALAPDAAVPVTLAGVLLARAGRLPEAERTLAHAATLDPENPILHNDHAAVLMRMQRHAAARAELEPLLRTHGSDVNILCNLATALISLGEQEEGVATAERAIALDPGATYARRTLTNALPYRHGVRGAEMLEAARNLTSCLPRPPAPRFTNRPSPDRKLRLGLLSGSLRAHPVGWLTIAGFETLDPDRFEITCFAQATATDAIARRFRAIATEWHDIAPLDDEAVAHLARERGIDVLIDLGGYGESGRVPVCAHRAAPVQVKWVGMQNHSTGMAEIDWMIADRWQIPPEQEEFYAERALRLADGYVCYSPPPYAPDPRPLPALGNGHVTFGCFNNLAKITPVVLQTWAEILHSVPGSRLVLKTYQFSEPVTAARIHQALADHGIAPARVELRGASPHRQFMAEYADIDLVLDPFPYSGGLTTCEALWMGVPTVTLPGETFSSRHSLSHLCNVGLTDWVARDLAHYRALACARAADIAALAALRAELRARMKASPLCDAPRFGRSLGAGLRRAWHDWCARAEA